MKSENLNPQRGGTFNARLQLGGSCRAIILRLLKTRGPVKKTFSNRAGDALELVRRRDGKLHNIFASLVFQKSFLAENAARRCDVALAMAGLPA